jgi:hypothetical protein
MRFRWSRNDAHLKRILMLDEPLRCREVGGDADDSAETAERLAKCAEFNLVPSRVQPIVPDQYGVEYRRF